MVEHHVCGILGMDLGHQAQGGQHGGRDLNCGFHVALHSSPALRRSPASIPLKAQLGKVPGASGRGWRSHHPWQG